MKEKRYILTPHDEKDTIPSSSFFLPPQIERTRLHKIRNITSSIHTSRGRPRVPLIFSSKKGKNSFKNMEQSQSLFSTQRFTKNKTLDGGTKVTLLGLRAEIKRRKETSLLFFILFLMHAAYKGLLGEGGGGERGERGRLKSHGRSTRRPPNPTQQRLLESWRKLGGEGEKDDIQHIL